MRLNAVLQYPQEVRTGIKKLTERFPGISKAFAVLGGYLAWTLFFRLLSLTFITYFVMSPSNEVEGSRFEEINETLASSQTATLAIAALIFVYLCKAFLHNWREEKQNGNWMFFQSQRFEKQFIPGFLHGSVLATGVALALLLSGVYRYLGFFIQTDNAPVAAASILVRTSSFLVLVYCEEYIFRHLILKTLAKEAARPSDFISLPSQKTSRGLPADFWTSLALVLLCGLFYVGMKVVQFDLGWMQALTLLLIAFSLGIRALSSGDFIQGAGYWASILIVFQVLLSLPVLGQDFSGLFLLKYQAAAPLPVTEIKDLWPTDPSSGETLRIITGGAGGPLASMAFQILLIFDLTRGVRRYSRRFKRI